MPSALTDNVQRPNYNTSSGQAVQVKTNHFKVDALPDKLIQQWSVAFETARSPPKTKAALYSWNTAMWNHPELQKELKGVRFIYNGGGIAYSCGKVPFESLNKMIDEDKKSRAKMVKTITINPESLQEFLKRKYRLDENVLQVINFLDALISDSPRRNFPTVFGTSQFFDPSNSKNVFNLGGGAQLWRGIFQSARPGPGYMTINVDVAHTAFYRPGVSVVDLLVENLNLQSANALQTALSTDKNAPRRVTRLLKGLGIVTTHTKRRDSAKRAEKIFAVDWKKSARQYTFEKEPGQMTTIEKYFAVNYNIKLKYPTLPILEMNGGKSRLPMELCIVASGQRFPNTLLDGRQTAEIVRQAAQAPADRLKSIEENLQNLNWRGDPVLQEYGLAASTTSIVANARQFESPVLTYAANQTMKPRDGKWNSQGKRLFTGSSLSSWGIMYFDDRDVSPHFEQALVASALRLGISVSATARTPPRIVVSPSKNLSETIAQLWNVTGNHFKLQPQMFVFVVTNYAGLYGSIKRVCDTECGIASQCVSSSKLRKANEQYCDNVWLKMNAKLGGVNTRLSSLVFSEPTLLLGADVSHPGAGIANAPSIASLVSNTDAHGVRFIGQARAQAARAEIITDLQELTRNAVLTYKKSVPKGPAVILYYRDGVGENQFSAIRSQELNAILKGCKDANINKPKITIVICQKRHHTRFFPTSPNKGDRLGNVKAGTVVDSGITHPVDFDFFLVAHTSFKGTARPTHYQVIHDDCKFKAETLQKLTHDMCYTFARSTTSVSLVPVTYYAHLVGNRVKAYCTGFDDTSSVQSGQSEAQATQALLPAIKATLREAMWFI